MKQAAKDKCYEHIIAYRKSQHKTEICFFQRNEIQYFPSLQDCLHLILNARY